MLEKELERKIVKRAKELGFLIYKFSSPSNRGVPDRIVISPSGDFFFIEFKSPDGKLTELQKQHINILKCHHVNTYIVCDFNYGLDILNSFLKYG